MNGIYGDSLIVSLDNISSGIQVGYSDSVGQMGGYRFTSYEGVHKFY